MTLSWVQPDLKTPSHVLQGEQGTPVATLEFAQVSGVVWNAKNPQRAEGRAGTPRWAFSVERNGVSGLLGLSATVLVAGPHGGRVDTGANFVNGKVILGGCDLEWHSSPTRPGGSRFTTPDATTLLHFTPGAIQDHVNTTVEIDPVAADRPDRWLLSILGLYLRIVGRRPFR